MTPEPTCPTELTAKYESLAWWAVKRMGARVPESDRDDATQVARLAIYRAALKWDRNRGVSFKSYAAQAAINNLLRG